MGISLFTTASRTALRPTQPPIQWVPGALSQEVKRQGREADHSCPSSAEVKNAWNYTSTSPYVFLDLCLIKDRNNFIFTFYTFENRSRNFTIKCDQILVDLNNKSGISEPIIR
jgi:hypothetical protein